MDANFIGLFSHSHSHGACDALRERDSSGPEFGIKCQKVTRRVASTRKLCNILLNVSISVSLSDLAQTVAVSSKFRCCLGPRMPRRQASNSNSNNYRQEQQQHRKESAERQQWQTAMASGHLDSVVLAQKIQEQQKKSGTRVTVRLATSLPNRVVELPNSQVIAKSCHQGNALLSKIVATLVCSTTLRDLTLIFASKKIKTHQERNNLDEKNMYNTNDPA